MTSIDRFTSNYAQILCFGLKEMFGVKIKYRRGMMWSGFDLCYSVYYNFRIMVT